MLPLNTLQCSRPAQCKMLPACMVSGLSWDTTAFKVLAVPACAKIVNEAGRIGDLPHNIADGSAAKSGASVADVAIFAAPGTSPSSGGNATASSNEPGIWPESGGPSVAAQAPIAPVAPVVGRGFSHAAAAAATAASGPGFGMTGAGVPSSIGGSPSSQTSGTTTSCLHCCF